MLGKAKAVDTVIIGAGCAGLNLSLMLQEAARRPHVVLECGEPLHAWKTKRWKNFRLNTPMGDSRLVGQSDHDVPVRYLDAPGCPIDEVVASWEKHIKRNKLPIIGGPGARVISVSSSNRETNNYNVDDDLLVETADGKTYRARNVVSAIGIYDKPRIPSFASKMSPNVDQLFPGSYRDVSQITGKSVLIVGSAQTGMQIANELASAGKKVVLATSNVAGAPRSICGKDIFYWMHLGGLALQHRSTLENEEEEIQRKQSRPFTGPNCSISYYSLARRGVTLTGSVRDVDGTKVFFQDNLGEHIKTAQESYEKFVTMLRKIVSEKDPDAPPYEMEEEWKPHQPLFHAAENPLSEIDLIDHDIQQVIWATGWTNPDFGFVKLPGVLDASLNKQGLPIQMETPHPGFFFLGADWLRTRSSALLLGLVPDAEHLMTLLRN